MKVNLITPGHSPRIGRHWNYEVHATRDGKPVAGKITAQLVDPAGTVQPVRFGNTPKNVLNWPFKGEFRDFIVWPPDALGVTFKLRLTVHAGADETVVSYAVTPGD